MSAVPASLAYEFWKSNCGELVTCTSSRILFDAAFGSGGELTPPAAANAAKSTSGPTPNRVTSTVPLSSKLSGPPCNRRLVLPVALSPFIRTRTTSPAAVRSA